MTSKHAWLAIVIASCGLGCPTFVDYKVGLGLGAVCTTTEECQGAECENGICTRHCDTSADCPSGSTCKAATCVVPAADGGSGD